MGVKNIVKKIGMKAGDKVAQLSSLSPAQVENIQLLREKYLLEMPNPNDYSATKQTERFMAASSVEIFNAYLPQIKELYLPIDNTAEFDGESFHSLNNIRYYNITRWVLDKKENSIEKLVNVYAVLSGEDCNIALIFDRKKDATNVYLAVVNTNNSLNNSDVNNYKEQLIEAVKGNFPGAELKEARDGIPPCFDDEKTYSVSTASNIPTESSERFISQTIEKLIDGVIPETKKQEYTIVLLATPILDVEDRKLKLGDFYSGLAPYASWSTSFQRIDNESIGSSATMGINIGASAGIQNGVNNSLTGSTGESENESVTDSDSISDTQSQSDASTSSRSIADTDSHTETITQTQGSSDTVGVNAGVHADVNAGVNGKASVGVLGAGANAGGSTGANVGAHYDHQWNRSTSDAIGNTTSQTITNGVAKTLTESTARTVGSTIANTLGRAVTKSMAATKGASKSFSFGGNIGANFARSSTITTMIGKNEGITQSYSNFNVQHALELLKDQMKRFEQSSALGMWDFAAYILSEDVNVTNNVAHSYLALTLGEESYMSKSAINTWCGNIEAERETAKEIYEYVKNLRHPIFGLNPEMVSMVEDEDGSLKIDSKDEESYIVYPPVVNATTCLSGKELAYSLNFPQKSIAGLPVLECVEFGRNIVTFEGHSIDDEEISLGNIFHMNHLENTPVCLSENSLASHTFITGSTGSGKSNTVYYMLEEAKKKGVKFLVVEPAKGEYKNVFGMRDDVFVYGTNPLISPLLRINPFSFPDNIHVLEHMDRLVEIFNVCWPMYAAMPAVLKNAIEKSYVDCGWDLVKSVNKYGEELYPSFVDVARNVKVIIDKSEYDAENKGAYKGSLLTRLESLSNGINGMILSSDELKEEMLFDENVIVDLSRVGSSETKSLLMGIMVLKLQEYRMSKATTMNAELNHITVLEEAHNLLRRTSFDKSSEGSNLLGKSVEMLSNAIAEMRTYGEGFIIADQAPGLMDMSVIRNTNTKIILRLPDQADRELVGRSANLNEDQIIELSKLPCGVAAVYQNEWIQPVLCKIELYNTSDVSYEYNPDMGELDKHYHSEVEDSLLDCIMEREIVGKRNKTDLSALKSKIIKSKLETYVKIDFLEYLDNNGDNAIKTLRTLVYDFLSADDAIIEAKQCSDIVEWSRAVAERLEPSLNKYSNKQIDLALALILYEQTIRDADYGPVFCRFTEVYQEKGGVL